MKTKQGTKRIEDIKKGDYVLARDERTGKQAYKRVKQTFVTRPDHLVTLRYRATEGKRSRRSSARRTSSKAGSSDDGDGSGSGHHAGYIADASHGKVGKKQGWTPDFALPGSQKDSSLTGTAVHPFWSVSRQAWIDMGALLPGEVLSLSDGSEAIVTGMSWEFAPEGERFTTYNFEVEDFHTYFVRGKAKGSSWVWVHNQHPAGLNCGRTNRSMYKSSSRTPRGNAEEVKDSMDAATRRGIEGQADAAQVLSRQGFDVEQGLTHTPATRAADGIAANAKPDLRVEGNLWDATTPATGRVRNIAGITRDKANAQQAYRFIINMNESPASITDLRRQYSSYAEEQIAAGVIEVFATRRGRLYRIFHHSYPGQ